MDNCLNCEKPLIHVEGRRKKEFCNATCRSKYWYKNRIKDAPKVAEPNSQHDETKPKERQKTTTVTTRKPTTLLELKALCPFPDGSDEKRVWVSSERQKYNL